MPNESKEEFRLKMDGIIESLVKGALEMRLEGKQCEVRLYCMILKAFFFSREYSNLCAFMWTTLCFTVFDMRVIKLILKEKCMFPAGETKCWKSIWFHWSYMDDIGWQPATTQYYKRKLFNLCHTMSIFKLRSYCYKVSQLRSVSLILGW